MLETLTIFSAISLMTYLITSHDKNVSKLEHLFKKCGLEVGDNVPIYKGKVNMTYQFKLPMGLKYGAVTANEDEIKETFPFNAVDLAFEHGYLKITIADPLPETIPFDQATLKGDWSFPVGQSTRGMAYHNFNQIPHILAAGMTRYGKTVFLRLLMVSVILQQPERSKFAVLDLKGGLSFLKFEKLKQTDTIASDINESVDCLRKIAEEIKGRQRWFKKHGIEKIQQTSKQKRVFIIVDEAAQLMSTGRTGKEALPYKECERLLAYIAQVGAGLGFHLVYCTQYPTMQSLPQQVKANCDATISFRLRNSTHNRVVFDDMGMAEDLPYIPGRAIYQSDRATEVQVPYVDDKQIVDLMRPYIREDVQRATDSVIKDQPTASNTLVIE